MAEIIFKTELTKGAKGSKGDKGFSYEVPTGAIIAYDGADTPAGYEDTDAPEGMSAGSNVSETVIKNTVNAVITNHAEGEIVE